MGVHTTFVRSVDLDEWTQRQIDSMRLGGNSNALAYFRKQGLTDMRTKIEKKYTSKAAQSYRTVLAKMVEAEAEKRGENVEGVLEGNGKSLLEALSLADQNEYDATVRENTSIAAAPVSSKATLASQNPNARGTLRTPPSSGNAPKSNLLRKPTATTVNMLKKKPSNIGSKLRINKLNSNATADEAFEDVETTVKAAIEVAADTQPSIPSTQVPPIIQKNQLPVKLSPVAANTSSPMAEPPKQTLEQNVAKLKALNSDFFSMA
jgi:ADP-ribosylation factor GTPase-activating protein 2/3